MSEFLVKPGSGPVKVLQFGEEPLSEVALFVNAPVVLPPFQLAGAAGMTGLVFILRMASINRA